MNLNEICDIFYQHTKIKITIIEPLKEKGLHFIYKIQFNQKEYVLKIYRKKLDFTNTNDLIEYLNINNIQTITNYLEFIDNNFIYKVYPYIEGNHILKYQEKEINEIAKIITILNKNTKKHSKETILDKCNSFFQYLLPLNNKKISNDIYELLYKSFKNLNLDTNSFILVHGDLSNTNLIWKNNTVSIIDFDESILAPKEYEVCSCLIQSCFHNNIFDLQQAKQLFIKIQESIPIDFMKWQESWNLYIIKVIIEKLYYYEQIPNHNLDKDPDHWSYWYELLLNENIISELWNYNTYNLINKKTISIIKNDPDKNTKIISDQKNYFIEKKEESKEENISKNEYNLVNLLNRFHLNELRFYNMNQTKLFSLNEGKTKQELTSKEIISLKKSLIFIIFY